jgi:hypothetical protein
MNQMRGIDVLVLRNVVGMLDILLHAPRGPFIAPRQLGVVESKSGRLILPSVDWCTGQSDARFLSLNGAADRWPPESRWRTGHVRCPLLAVGSATCPA